MAREPTHGAMIDFSFEERKIKIGDELLPMTADAAKLCRNKGYPKKTLLQVRFNEIGEVTDIEPYRAPAPAAPQQQKPAENRTSPQAPATKPGLKTVEGQIADIDHGTHKIVVKDRSGQRHEFIWPASISMTNSKGDHIKKGWFISVSGELSGDTWRLTSHKYFKRPEDWPGGSGSGSNQSRNDKAILFQCLFKGAIELAKQDGEYGSAKTLEDRVLACAKAAAAALPDACTATGVQ